MRHGEVDKEMPLLKLMLPGVPTKSLHPETNGDSWHERLKFFQTVQAEALWCSPEQTTDVLAQLTTGVHRHHLRAALQLTAALGVIYKCWDVPRHFVAHHRDPFLSLARARLQHKVDHCFAHTPPFESKVPLEQAQFIVSSLVKSLKDYAAECKTARVRAIKDSAPAMSCLLDETPPEPLLRTLFNKLQAAAPYDEAYLRTIVADIAKDIGSSGQAWTLEMEERARQLLPPLTAGGVDPECQRLLESVAALAAPYSTVPKPTVLPPIRYDRLLDELMEMEQSQSDVTRRYPDQLGGSDVTRRYDILTTVMEKDMAGNLILVHSGPIMEIVYSQMLKEILTAMAEGPSVVPLVVDGTRLSCYHDSALEASEVLFLLVRKSQQAPRILREKASLPEITTTFEWSDFRHRILVKVPDDASDELLLDLQQCIPAQFGFRQCIVCDPTQICAEIDLMTFAPRPTDVPHAVQFLRKCFRDFREYMIEKVHCSLLVLLALSTDQTKCLRGTLAKLRTFIATSHHGANLKIPTSWYIEPSADVRSCYHSCLHSH